MLQEIFIPFIAISLAELGDKTQLAVFCLASKTKKYIPLLMGIMLAFALTDGLAIIFGNFITTAIPIKAIKLISGAYFIIFGIIALVQTQKPEAKCELNKPFTSGFSTIFLAEMGDKTQIASGLFATKFNPFFVFIGVILALAILSVIAIYIGSIVIEKLDRKLVSNVTGIIFIILGIFFII